MKRAVIITPFDNYSYHVRIKYVEQYLFKRGYEVIVISSDYDHRNKTIYSANRENLELLHVPRYRKNLSFARIYSHQVFAKKALKRLEQLKPDLVYCSAPPNLLFKYISQYKKRHSKIRLIYELGDLWPETLPLNSTIKKIAFPVLKVWTGIRNNNIGFADEVLYECQFFCDVVSKVHPGIPGKVIYLSKEDYYKGHFTLNEDSVKTLRFAYVGSINNIIDIEFIVEIMKLVNLKRKAELIVIGGGESATRFFTLCDDAGIPYKDYGIVYNEEEKHHILSTCQFGLNIMKDSVLVGATMKSLEYFHEGLIIVNNIRADTEMIIDEELCGFNITKQNYSSLISFVEEANDTEINQYRLNSRRVFEKLFSSDNLTDKFDSLFTNI